jgi:hypothetical protein
MQTAILCSVLSVGSNAPFCFAIAVVSWGQYAAAWSRARGFRNADPLEELLVPS